MTESQSISERLYICLEGEYGWVNRLFRHHAYTAGTWPFLNKEF